MIARTLIAAALLGATPSYAAGPAAPAPGETRIREMADALEWVVDPGRGVYVRDYRGRWYYARARACPRLLRQTPLRFDTSPGGYLDRDSWIRAGGFRCRIVSVVESEGPPRRRRG
jgi:hypothetical protein